MSDEKKVEIPESQLSELLKQNQQLLNNQQVMQAQINEMAANQDQGFQPILKDASERPRTVRVAFVDGNPMLGIRNRGSEARPQYIYERQHPNDPKIKIAYADLLIKGQEEPITVNWNEFQREADMREMEIKDTKVDPWEIDQGFVNKKQWTGSEMVETAVRVPVKVKGERRLYVVEDAAHGEFVIDEQWVNIR